MCRDAPYFSKRSLDERMRTRGFFLLVLVSMLKGEPHDWYVVRRHKLFVSICPGLAFIFATQFYFFLKGNSPHRLGKVQTAAKVGMNHQVIGFVEFSITHQLINCVFGLNDILFHIGINNWSTADPEIWFEGPVIVFNNDASDDLV